MTQSPFFQHALFWLVIFFPKETILQPDQRRLLEISKEIHKEAVEILGLGYPGWSRAPSDTVVFFFWGGEGVWYV